MTTALALPFTDNYTEMVLRAEAGQPARSLDDGTGHCRDCGAPIQPDGSHISARSGAHIPAQPQEVTA